MPDLTPESIEKARARIKEVLREEFGFDDADVRSYRDPNEIEAEGTDGRFFKGAYQEERDNANFYQNILIQAAWMNHGCLTLPLIPRDMPEEYEDMMPCGCLDISLVRHEPTGRSIAVVDCTHDESMGPHGE